MMWIETVDGVALEARWDDPVDTALGVVVLCHPHPLDRGTMNTPLMRRITAILTEAGLHVLRFNFRGVGMSEGSWGEGVGEILDVAAAVATAELAFADLPLGLSGWSFGASTSLAWQGQTGSTLPWVGIAPGIRSYRGATPPDPGDLAAAQRLIVMGDRDQFATVEQMTDYAARMGATLEIVEGSDHFFVFRERRVGALVAAHFGGRPITPLD